jgi:putative transposase
MPKKAHTEEQIVAVLRQGEAGEKVGDICRKVGISEGTYYVWKKQYAGLGVSELRELRRLRDENGRLKRRVADLSLDKQILQEIVSKKLVKPGLQRKLGGLLTRYCAGRRPTGPRPRRGPRSRNTRYVLLCPKTNQLRRQLPTVSAACDNSKISVTYCKQMPFNPLVSTFPAL